MARRQARCDIYCWYFHMMYEGHGVCVFRQCGLVWRWMMQNTYEALKAPSACIISVTTSVSAKKGGQVKSCEWHHMATTLLFPTRWLCCAAAHITALGAGGHHQLPSTGSQSALVLMLVWLLMQRSCVDVEGTSTDTDVIAKESMYCKVKA